MLEIKEMPLIPGQNQKDRQIRQVKDVDFTNIAVRNGAFSLHVGDIITFDDIPLLVEQSIPNTSAKCYWVGCMRNGKPSWIGLGFLTRRDYYNNPIDRLQELMNSQPNFLAMYENVLRGHKIIGGTVKTYHLAVFVDGVRQDTPRAVPLVEAIYE